MQMRTHTASVSLGKTFPHCYTYAETKCGYIKKYQEKYRVITVLVVQDSKGLVT